MKPQYPAAAALLLIVACGQGENRNRQASAAGQGGATAAASGSEGLTIQPGEWEVTTQMQMGRPPNMPAGMRMPDVPPTTTRHCTTAEDVARGNRAFLGGGSGAHGVDCDYRNVSIAGGRIQGVSTCRRAGMEMAMTMDGTMTPTAYDIDERIRMTMRGRTSETTGHMSGRRVGECAASARP